MLRISNEEETISKRGRGRSYLNLITYLQFNENTVGGMESELVMDSYG